MATAKKNKGPRPRHIPQRTCIACRRSDPKRSLFRIVRDAEGRVSVDPTGKKAGRGAYLCGDPACWERALGQHGLARALKIEKLHPDDRATLEAFAQTLPAHDAES